MPNPRRIDLQQKYPCPCCRGQINQLVLTEAFGCDQCQKIFVLQDDGYVLEQVSTIRPSRWRWDGQRWRGVKAVTISIWTVSTAILLSLLFIYMSWYFLIPDRRDRPSNPPATNESQDR